MEILKSIIAFLVAIGILVTIHELGHYWAARLCGVKIIRFSIGFGRTLWMRKFGADQTEWVVAALPLGGFVKMADERDEVLNDADRGRAFNNKPIWQRMIIIAAGPAANFVLAAVLYWVVFVVGAPGALPWWVLAQRLGRNEGVGEIWSDIACPWCYVGKRRFEAALQDFEHRDQVTVTWRSFELDPTA
ncbi:MAG: site-2 protease family protein, partial [Aeromicrobium sp.]|nr:site-2 protease family protein [Burkholderiales bacterium]